MKKTEVILKKDGTKVIGDEFDNNDFEKLKIIFQKWLNINKDLKPLGGRNLNVPDVFSEALFCIYFNAIRTNNTAYSFDCVLKNTGEGVQVKSASIKNDCTSFGPTSTWDLLYFVDFAPNGKVDGEIYFYNIKDDYIYNSVLNHKRNETFRDQQKQRRRPRLSIKKIIYQNNLQPVKKINLLSN